MWKKILIGILVFFVILIIIKRRQNKMKYKDGNVWDEVSRVSRDACSKIKDFLFGC